MTTPTTSRVFAAAIVVPVVAGMLTGCIFPQGHGAQIENAAQAALDASDQHGGVDMFNTSEGLGDTWDLNLCIEAPASETPQQLAERVVDALNVVSGVVDTYQRYLGEAEVRVVDEAAKAQDLDNWCREESFRGPLDGPGLLDLQEASDLIPGTGTHSWPTDLSIQLPYGEVAVVIPSPTATATPTPSPAPTP